ncbi:metallophosphoesterase family protein [Sinisalibacter aestuarii]|nr:metallophosphoesterase family protein [Sinisalibacter aestuarii]
MRLFSSIARSRTRIRCVGFDTALEPAETLAVVGDIHGCDQLLEALLDDISSHDPDQLVFVGDYIDRGEKSAAVLDRLYALSQANPAQAVFLRGNHEEMLLRFLDNPEQDSRRWLKFGGLQTLASFGIGGINETANAEQAMRARDALANALGPDLLTWLRALPSRFTSGNVAVVHAGADPDLPIAAQSPEVLTWGHRDFTARPRKDGCWVVHGHTIVAEVSRDQGRIGVDTGAYATGRLSAALIGPNRFEVLTSTY